MGEQVQPLGEADSVAALERALAHDGSDLDLDGDHSFDSTKPVDYSAFGTTLMGDPDLDGNSMPFCLCFAFLLPSSLCLGQSICCLQHFVLY